ncbi:hypothetical protein K9T45_001617 [Campylobacter jejuni]|nr:hypothetical protein [Campylobacter jejuni]
MQVSQGLKEQLIQILKEFVNLVENLKNQEPKPTTTGANPSEWKERSIK